MANYPAGPFIPGQEGDGRGTGYDKKEWLEKLDEEFAEPKHRFYDVTGEQFEQIKTILQENKKKGDILNLDEEKGKIDYLTPTGEKITVKDGKLSKILFDWNLETKISKIINIK